MKYCKEQILKNGKKVAIRNLIESDAEILADYRIKLLKQRGFIVQDGSITKESQLEYIKMVVASQRIIYLVAVTLDNEIVGHVMIRLRDNTKQLSREDLTFGVTKDFCGVSLINLLAECLVEVANDSEFIKKERVRAREQNKYERARNQFNYQTLDRIEKTMQYIVGKYADEIYMNQIYRVGL